MKSNFLNELPQETQEKTKKNLVWILVFSIAMFFAGLTSAYIVSKGDNFWVKVELPKEFWVSTALILLSSITLFLCVKAIKVNAIKKSRIFLVLTLILGLGFAYMQFQGYKSLINKGAMAVSHILVTDGRYGEYYSIKMDNQELEMLGTNYGINGAPISETQSKELKDFTANFKVGSAFDRKLDLPSYGSKFKLYYKDEPLSLVNGRLMKTNGESLKELEYERLSYLARNIKDGRGDFFIAGEMGKDFHLFFKGKELQYKNRTLLTSDGKELSQNFQNKLLRGNSDTASTYLWLITFLHLLHVVAGVIMLAVYTKRSLSSNFNSDNTLYLKSGSIFWHFLGLLWVYLLLFLLFIH